MSGASEHAAQIVPEPGSVREREWITETAFWAHLWQDFPNLARVTCPRYSYHLES